VRGNHHARSGAAGGGAIHLSTVTCVDARDQRASGVTAPAGSLVVWSTGVIDVGWGDEAQPLYVVSTRR